MHPNPRQGDPAR